MRAVLLGGFEPSGHDSVSAALLEAGRRRGHAVTGWAWRDAIESTDHPIFHLHRIATRFGAPEIAGVMDDPRLIQGLAQDLNQRLVLPECEAVISTHPWSTALYAAQLDASRCSIDTKRPLLIDCHGEFSPFPIPLIAGLGVVDAFVGGELRGAFPPRVQRRSWCTGVPVRQAFSKPVDQRQDRRGLAVSLGHRFWALTASEELLAIIVRVLNPQQLFMIGNPEPAARESIEGISGLRESVVWVSEPDEIAAALSRSSHIVTKASGAAVAEAAARECVPLCPASGVFWEDEARAYLSGEGVIVPIDKMRLLSTDDWSFQRPWQLRAVGARAREAAASIWEIVEAKLRSGLQADPPPRRPEADQAAGFIEGALTVRGELPHTSAAVSAALNEWLSAATFDR